MKTLILATASAAALLAAAGGAYAQTGSATVESQFSSATKDATGTAAPKNAVSNSYANQFGSGNSADISQVGGAYSLKETKKGTTGSDGRQLSVVLQGWGASTSTNNQATVDQSNTSEQSVVMQRDAEGASNSNNYAPGKNTNNTATVTQTGAHENAFAYQSGRKNSIKIQESGSGSSSLSNAYTTSVTDRSQGDSGASFARGFEGVDNAYNQMGRESTEVVQIDSKNNAATVNQQSDNSAAHIVQWFAERNTAKISQDVGAKNSQALTYQTGHDSDAKIHQSSANDSAVIFQVSGDDGYGSGDNSYSNHAKVEQGGGASNTALVLQAGHDQHADVRQMGTSNEAYSHQDGRGNDVSINQTASSMEGLAVTDQTGSGGKAVVTQMGYSDTSYVSQHGTAGSYMDPTNTAKVSQYGDRETSLLYQDGKNNDATVKQYGDRDYSYLNQTGTGGMNTATITQNADKVMSVAYQNGGANTLTVTQGMAMKLAK